MKSFLNTDRAFARTNKPPLLLAAVTTSVLCLLASAFCPASLRAQDFTVPGAMPSLQLPDIKPAKKPQSDKKWAFSLLPVGLQKNPQVDYVIFTEMTNEGRKLPEPSHANPVFYIASAVGQRDVGDAYGGTKPIPYEKLRRLLDNSLASNGYILTTADSTERPPSQVLFFAWGMHNKIDTSGMGFDDGGDTTIDSGDGAVSADGDTGDGGGASPQFSSIAADTSGLANLLSRAKIVGGKKFAAEYRQAMMEGRMAMRQFAERDETTETLVYAVQNECYYLLVTSLDAEALARREKKVLWTTTISTISRGVSFDETLPIMVNNVSWFLGRETVVAEILTKRAYKSATVEIHEPTVVEFISGTTSATGTTAKPAPATTGTTSAKP